MSSESETDRYTDTDLVLEENQLVDEWCRQFGVDNITSSPLRVAGVSFRQDNVKLCKVGNEVSLTAEPDNKFDQHAIRVYVKCWRKGQRHVGYVPKDCCLTVKQAISRKDYKGCRVAKIGRPAENAPIGIQLALLFEKDPPDLYAPF